MTLSAIHNWDDGSVDYDVVVCDYRGDMTLSAIHNRRSRVNPAFRVVCDIGGI